MPWSMIAYHTLALLIFVCQRLAAFKLALVKFVDLRSALVKFTLAKLACTYLSEAPLNEALGITLLPRFVTANKQIMR